ncbi:hypothetical protein C8R46DRAFT_857701, partial [Mycena filopes]
IDVDVKLEGEGEEQRKQAETNSGKERAISCPIYYDATLSAARYICVRVRDKRKTQHDGIEVASAGT